MNATASQVSGCTMSLGECVTKMGARLAAASHGATHFAGVSTDSRTVGAGQLFVALKGPSFDGHQFVARAAERGAAAAMVSTPVDTALPQVVVGDTTWGLAHLAMLWRSRFSLPVMALTGSNGKTTVKEMLRAILVAHAGSEASVLATEGNLNNNIGLPLMMLRLASTHRFAVFEMGMNHVEEIDYLTRLAVPDMALIIMAGTAHIGELGSREAIAQAKGEIFHGLRDDGVACLNIDDRFADYWRGVIGPDRRVITFGTDLRAIVRGALTADGVTLFAEGKSAHARLQVAGEHNQRNAIAAAAGAFALGVPVDTIASGLTAFAGVAGRLRNVSGHNAATIIDDTYNANPDSMRAAIAVLATKPGKRILVLGDMGELGKDAADMHAEIGRAAAEGGIPVLAALGENARGYVSAFGAGAAHHDSVETLVASLKPRLDADTTVLVKGSRFMRMERVVAGLAAPGAYTQKGSH